MDDFCRLFNIELKKYYWCKHISYYFIDYKLSIEFSCKYLKNYRIAESKLLTSINPKPTEIKY